MLNKIDKVLTHVENAITGSLFIASLLVLGWNIIMRKVFHNASTWAEEAIRYAIHHGQPGDIVVLAGKGHEDYQEIKGKKYPMDERVLIQEILEEDKK